MTNPRSDADQRKDFDQWVLKLDPDVKASLEMLYKVYEDGEEAAGQMMGTAMEPVFDLMEEVVIEVAKAKALAKEPTTPPAKATGGTEAGATQKPDKASDKALKVGVEYDVAVTPKPIKKTTDYGVFELTATAKVKPTVFLAGSSDSRLGSSTSYTSKDKPEGRQGGFKQALSADILDKKLLDGLKFTDLSFDAGGEWSGSDISAYGQLNFKMKTPFFEARGLVKGSLFFASEGESPKVLALELRVQTPAFELEVKSAKVSVYIEFKGSFTVLWGKVGLEILKKIAKKKLEQEAKKQGVKFLGRKAAEKIMTKLGPIVSAFGIGWDIGTFLNDFTVADEVALKVDETILGDLNVRYHQAGTLDKMILITKNSPRIVAALIASGVAGAGAGIGDLVVFKIMGLDKLGDFGKALKDLGKMLDGIPSVGEVVGDVLISSAVRMGIKFNPKYHRISHPAFAKLAISVHAKIRPIFKRRGALQALIDLKIYDVLTDESQIDQIVAQIVKGKLGYGTIDSKKSPDEITIAFMEMGLQELLSFMEAKRLISYNVNLGDDLSMKSLNQQLVNEVFL